MGKTYSEIVADQQNEITGHWFKNHRANFETFSPNLSTLTWREEGTLIFFVRYIFDGANMYISGDLGEAVFRFTEKAVPERIAHYNLDYFCEKLRALNNPTRDFSCEYANEYLDMILKDYEDENVEYDKGAFAELRRIIDNSTRVNDFHRELYDFDYYRIGNDAWEWLSDIGSVIPMQLRAYLEGIKMAVAQIDTGGSSIES